MRTVSFTKMEDGTQAEYEFLRDHELEHIAGLADRLLENLEGERESFEGYQVTRYEHALQAATRAERAGETEEYVVAMLFHDIGGQLAPDKHGEMAAAVLAPYVSEEIAWIVRNHGLFQAYYYAHFFGQDRNTRDKYKDHRYYDACVKFCQDYDQGSFDPEYPSEAIEHFVPMVRRVISLENRKVA